MNDEPLDPDNPPVLGTTVCWQGEPVPFFGIPAGTDQAVINIGEKYQILVSITDLTLYTQGS